MKCPFNIGDVVKINDSADVAHNHIGETAVVINCNLMGLGERTPSKPIEHDNLCLATIQFNDEEVLSDVPSSELNLPRK